jgi:hypothetical protein
MLFGQNPKVARRQCLLLQPKNESNDQDSKGTQHMNIKHLIDLHLRLQALALHGIPYVSIPLKLSSTHSDPYRSKVGIVY